MNQALQKLKLNNISVVCHYPLSKLIADWSLLTLEERTFSESPFSHLDFLLYNTITKRPWRAIEVDGWHFHNDSLVQQTRDKLKDSILTKYNLILHRFSTTDIVTVETLKDFLALS